MDGRLIYVTVAAPAVVNNATATGVATMPKNYDQLAGIFINPAIQHSITIQSQKTKQLILENFDSRIGTLAWVPIGYIATSDDRIIVTLQNRSGATQDLFVNVAFGVSNVAMLPPDRNPQLGI